MFILFHTITAAITQRVRGISTVLCLLSSVSVKITKCQVCLKAGILEDVGLCRKYQMESLIITMALYLKQNKLNKP